MTAKWDSSNRDMARALVRADYMPLSDYIAIYGEEPLADYNAKHGETPEYRVVAALPDDPAAWTGPNETYEAAVIRAHTLNRGGCTTTIERVPSAVHNSALAKACRKHAQKLRDEGRYVTANLLETVARTLAETEH